MIPGNAFRGRAFGLKLLLLGLAAGLDRQARNALRLALGRERHQRDNRAAGQVLGHVLGLGAIGHVTHGPAPGEGAGSQALAMLMAQALAEELGATYAHTPFLALNHAEGDAAAFARRWEELLGLGDGSMSSAEATGPRLDINTLFHSDLYNSRSRALLHRAMALRLHALRARYHAGRPPECSGPLAVAIHVRRGDVSATRNAHMWTPPEQVREAAQRLAECLQGAGIAYDLVIVSQGTEADFPELAGLDCRFVLDEDPLASFERLAAADVLVVAKSSYSCLAGLLSRGVVLEDDCGYLRLPHWIAAPGGRFDKAALLEALAPVLAERA